MLYKENTNFDNYNFIYLGYSAVSSVRCSLVQGKRSGKINSLKPGDAYRRHWTEVIIAGGYDLSPMQHQAITWNIDDFLSIGQYELFWFCSITKLKMQRKFRSLRWLTTRIAENICMLFRSRAYQRFCDVTMIPVSLNPHIIWRQICVDGKCLGKFVL